MGWPKGMPRKGHINKDGSPHNPKRNRTSSKDTGTKLTLNLPRRSMREVGVTGTGISPVMASTSSIPKPLAKPVLPETPVQPVKYTTKLVHAQYSIEPCPECGFGEADGGWCPDCGWSLPRPELQPANTSHGPLFGRK